MRTERAQAEQTIRLDSYRLTLATMTPANIPKLHELSIAVNWPHRPHDWDLLIRLGHGYVAHDEIGRIVGSAMWFPMGPRRATIGMVITAPRLQDNGAGRWLMRHVLDATAGREKVLNATKEAYRLYLSLGFSPLRTVFQHNGVVTSVPGGSDSARPMAPGDREAILRLDATAFGADRRHVLNLLFPVSEGSVIERDGTIAGFALCREFGRGRVIGPIVAASTEDAIALIRPHLATHLGQFMRVDTREADGVLRRFLDDVGILSYDSVTTMTRDFLQVGDLFAGPACRPFGLVNQALS